MTRATTTSLLVLLVAGATALAQPEQGAPAVDEATRAELARIRDEAIALDDAGRYALAAEKYLELHDAMQRAGLPRAPIALWSAGLALTHVAGRERDARDTLQRFLDASTSLTEDAQIRDWRSTALEHISELNARMGSSAQSGQTAGGGGGISPIGPIVLGVGGAAVIVGIITGAVALSQGDQIRGECGSSTCPPAYAGRASNLDVLNGVTDGLLFGGAAVAITGLVLTLVLRDGGGDTPPPVALGCGSSGCGLSLRGAFQ